jgi:hypothetical protein
MKAEALTLARTIRNPETRVDVLAGLSLYFPDPEKHDILQEAIEIAQTIGVNERLGKAFEKLLPNQISDDLQQQVQALVKMFEDSVQKGSGERATEQPASATEPFERLERFDIPPRGLADTTGEKKDLLGFSDYAQALADFIRDKDTEKPLTIGIDAPWGMGKTTLMKMLMNKLNGEEEKQKAAALGVSQATTVPVSQPPLPTVWFDAWTYDQEESLWAALVLEILAQIRKQIKWYQRLWLWVELNWKRFDKSLIVKSLFKLLAYIAGIGLIAALVTALASLLLNYQWQVSVEKLSDYLKYLYTIGLVGLIPVSYSVIKDLLNGVVRPFDLKVDQYVREPNYKEKVGFLAQFKKDYECVIDCVARDPTRPLVIFIDDLDRCAPPRPAEIIEAISLLLDAKNCVFVIGMDAKMIAASLEAKYKDLKAYVEDVDDPGGLTLGQRFLEKIFQINFHIPRADPERVDSFISAIVGATDGKPAAEPSGAEVAEAVQSIEAKQSAGMSTEEAARQVGAEKPDLGEAAVAKAKQEVFVRSFNDSEIVLAAIREAKQYLGLNPRKIKRFVNNFRLQALIANRRGMFETQEVRLDLLSRFLIIQMRWHGALDAVMADSQFINTLNEAHSLRWGTFGKGSGSGDKERLERYLANLHIKRWVDAAELVDLLKSINEDELKRLPVYLYLAQITIKPRLTL